jgi:hypothetical protein
VNDLLLPAGLEDVEALLRHTLAARAEDMAPGDAGAEGPSASSLPPEGTSTASSPPEGPSTASFAPAIPFPPVGPSATPFPPGGRGRHGRRRLLAAAAAAVVFGAGAAAAAVAAGHDRSGDEGTVAGEPTTGDPTTATSAPESPTTLSPLDRYAEEFGSYPIATLVKDGASIRVSWEPPGADSVAASAEAQTLTVGPWEAQYFALPDGSITGLWLRVDDGTVSLMSGNGVTRALLIEIAATATIDAATGAWTVVPPAGWSVTGTTADAIAAAQAPAAPADPVPLSGYARQGRPDETVNGIWYPGWTEANLADNAEPVTVGDGTRPAYVGSIAPEAMDNGLRQLWIVYDDGVVELQSAGPTRDELVALAAGVTRDPATGELSFPAPDGWVPAG